MKYHIFLGLFAVAAAYPGIIHQDSGHLAESLDHQALIGESGHHHQVQHEHAKSHQSIKFEHFHPVPVYVKKEHSHLLHHPLEKGKSEQELKQIHPETHHSHGGGLVLKDHRLDTEHFAASLGHGGFEHGSLGGYEHGFEGLEHGLEGASLGHGSLEQSGYEQFEGGYGGGEGLKEYASESGQYFGGAGNSGESYNYGHY